MNLITLGLTIFYKLSIDSALDQEQTCTKAARLRVINSRHPTGKDAHGKALECVFNENNISSADQYYTVGKHRPNHSGTYDWTEYFTAPQ